MGILGWIWDMNQDRDIREAHGAAREAASSMRSTETELADLRASVDRLTLTNHAMWELLRDRLELQDSDLLARIEAIDLRDGVSDGRMASAVAMCPACGRPNRAKRAGCLYRGAKL